MSKKVVVFFSGGLDSTFLVYKNLKEGNEVFPVYVDIQNNINKSILEKNRTNILYKLFAEEYNKTEIKIHGVETILSLMVNGGMRTLFKQLPIWLFSTLCIGEHEKYDEIQIGYVLSDDTNSYLDDIKNIYNSYLPIIEHPVPLVFPIIKKAKFQMALELPSKYFENIFSCEAPKIIGDEHAEYIKYEPCCNCQSCDDIIGGDYYGLGMHRFPDNYKKNLINRKIQELNGLDVQVYDENGNVLPTYDKLQAPCEDRPKEIQLELDLGLPDINYECDYEIEPYEPLTKLNY
jgi:hypothetical protein